MNPSTTTTTAYPRLRLATWALVVIVELLGQLAWLHQLRGPRILDNDRLLIGGQIVLMLPLLAMAGLLATTPANAIKLRARTSAIVILFGALVLNVAALMWIVPALSEDLIRYRVDGAAWLAGYSPYVTPPANMRSLDGVDRAVTYPEVCTIYPPVAQLLFANVRLAENVVGEWIAPSPTIDWRGQFRDASPAYWGIAYRGTFAALSLVAGGVLMAILQRARRSVWWAVLLCWNPLATMEIAGQGHQDILGIVFLLLAFLLVQRERFLVAALVLALSAGVKPLAILLVPFLVRDVRRGRGMPYADLAIGVFVIAMAVVYLPIWASPEALAGWLQTGQNYSHAWEANGSVYELIKLQFGQGDNGHAMERAKQTARVIALAGLLLAYLFTWQARATLAEAGYWLFLTLLLFSPVAYPWYLLWAVAMIPLARPPQGMTGLVWSGTIGVSYVLWREPSWTLPVPWMWIEYAPVLIFLLAEWASLLRSCPFKRCARPPAALEQPA